MKYTSVKYNDKYYMVIGIKYKGHQLPFVLDYEDYRIIKKMNKKWRCNSNGNIYTTHTYKGVTKDVYLHEVVMNIKYAGQKDKILQRPILHINRVGLDNRQDNLIYNVPQQKTYRNQKKKKRTIQFPNGYSLHPDELPTYVWYMKPDGTHGDRFLVSIGDINYKTTSSRNVSIEDKLEEAKSFLRKLKKDKPELFNNYSMNGDYNNKGKQLLDSYHDIVELAGYDYIQRGGSNGNTKVLLQPDNKRLRVVLDSDSYDSNSDSDSDSNSEGDTRLLTDLF